MHLEILTNLLDRGSTDLNASTYTGEYNTGNRGQISMPRAGFETRSQFSSGPRPYMRGRWDWQFIFLKLE